MAETPQAVLDVLKKLDASDRATMQSYLDELKGVKFGGADAEMEDEDDSDGDLPDLETVDDKEKASDEAPFPPLYESGEDFDKASEAKQAADDFKCSGDWEKALEKYTEAVLAAPPSALLYANRATALFQLGRLGAAERDCDMALKENPDSAKALRVRGKVKKELGKYEEALTDLSQAQTIDFDEGTVEDLKFLAEERVRKEKADADKRNKEEDKIRKRASEIKRAQEEAKREAKEQARERSSGMPGGGMGGMPGMGMPGMGGGMPGGMGGMDAMGSIMSDPEIVAALQKPKVQAAFQSLMSGGMSDPSKMQELMMDPEVGPVLQKVMAKLGGGGGGGGMGAGGGFGGMGGGGMGAGGMGAHDDDSDGDDDDIPDLEEIN